MTDKMPKDYQMAEAAYNAFHGQQPTVWFHELAHAYQMKWVAAAREMVKLHDSKKYGPREHKPAASPKTKFKHSQATRDAWAVAKRRSISATKISG